MPLQVGEFFQDECPVCGAMTRCEVLERHPSGEASKWRQNPEHLAWHRSLDRILKYIAIALLVLGFVLGAILGFALTGLVMASLVAEANRHVPFPLAASWCGVGYGDAGERGSKAWCPFGVLHPDQGRERAFRIWPDHGWCFAEHRYFTSVSLLAAKWEVTREEAAKEALDRIGRVPASYAHLWEDAQRPQDPGREFLAMALREWCASSILQWDLRQYDPVIAGKLAQCLTLLPLVKDADDCERWLEGTRKAMGMFSTG